MESIKKESNESDGVSLQRPPAMFEGRNIHQSPVDGKLLCSYSEKVCMQRRLNGYAFCIRHILEDKCAPFKQCEFFAKYNGSRCINPVPVAENRTYCNSHLQVLGLLPKKVRKKKATSANKEDVIPEMQKSGKGGANTATVKKRKKATSNASPVNTGSEKEATAKRLARKKSIKDERLSRSIVASSVGAKVENDGTQESPDNLHPDVNAFHKCYQTGDTLERNYLQTYAFDFENEPAWLHPSDIDSLASRYNAVLSHAKARPVQKLGMNNKICQIKRWMRMNQPEPQCSYSVLKAMVKAARSNPSQLADIITRHKIGSDRGVGCHTTPTRLCSFSDSVGQCCCGPLPFSGYCFSHIDCDKGQVLFSRCTEALPSGLPCAGMAFQHGNEPRLCNEHLLSSPRKVDMATSESLATYCDTDAVNHEEIGKPLQVGRSDKNHSKQQAVALKSNTGKKSLKAHIQKKFSIIPTFSANKMNLHVKNRTGRLKITMPTSDEPVTGSAPVISNVDITNFTLSSGGCVANTASTVYVGTAHCQPVTSADIKLYQNGETADTRDSSWSAGGNCVAIHSNATRSMPSPFKGSADAPGQVHRLLAPSTNNQGGLWSSGASVIETEARPGPVYEGRQSAPFHLAPSQPEQQQQTFLNVQSTCSSSMHAFPAFAQTLSDFYPQSSTIQMGSNSNSTPCFALPLRPTAPLKPFVRLTSASPSHTMTFSSSAPLISPSFQLASPARSQIFRLDPTIANTFITRPSVQHQPGLPGPVRHQSTSHSLSSTFGQAPMAILPKGGSDSCLPSPRLSYPKPLNRSGST